MRGAWRAALFAALCLAAAQGRSHDSWLSPARASAPHGGLALELATGNRYPVQEFSQSPASLAQSGCADGAATLPLRPTRVHPQWLDLLAPAPRRSQLISCWVELGAVDIEIEPRLVEVYFAEIRTPAANRDAWAALQARGLPWRESYRKFARIELAPTGDGPPEGIAASRRPVGLDLEIVVLGEQAVAVGQPLEFQVLRDGVALAGFPVELVSERSPVGVWRETDSAGKLRHRLPFAGRWLLRGTDLRLSARHPDRWESRFVTLAIEAH
jgi:uncharacterized protein DUF4198